MVEQNTDIESIIKKISMEIDEVKSHVSSAKYSFDIGNKQEAISHLKQAHDASTCSYCKNKLSEIILDIEHNSGLCNINSKSCEVTKHETLQKMTEFHSKLPSIEEIRKRKATSVSEDPFQLMMKSFDDMGKSFWKLMGWG